MRDLDPHVICGSLGPRNSTRQTASRSIQPFLHSSRQIVPILYNGLLLHPQNCPFPLEDMDLHLIHNSLDPFKSTTRTASQFVQPFLHSSLQSVPLLYSGLPLTLQNCPFSWGIWIMVSWAHPSPQAKRHLDRFDHFCRAH